MNSANTLKARNAFNLLLEKSNLKVEDIEKYNAVKGKVKDASISGLITLSPILGVKTGLKYKEVLLELLSLEFLGGVQVKNKAIKDDEIYTYL